MRECGLRVRQREQIVVIGRLVRRPGEVFRKERRLVSLDEGAEAGEMGSVEGLGTRLPLRVIPDYRAAKTGRSDTVLSYRHDSGAVAARYSHAFGGLSVRFFVGQSVRNLRILHSFSGPWTAGAGGMLSVDYRCAFWSTIAGRH
jgi:hypothetical protein